MADQIFEEMQTDILRIAAMLNAIECATRFISLQPIDINPDMLNPKSEQKDFVCSFLSKANSVNTSFREAHSGLPSLRGALLLSAISRFEAFIKDEIEELAAQATQRATKYGELPRDMKENLIRWSGEVIANPKKYRMERRIGEIIKNLAANLSDNEDISFINHFCLSITTENLRPDTLSELFKRLGIKNYWERISKIPEFLTFFETTEENNALSAARTRLNKLIDIRNEIAHSPQKVYWPSHDYVCTEVEFIRVLAEATSKSIPVFALSFKVQQQTQSS